MIKKYNSLSFLFGVPGIVLQILCFVAVDFISSISMAILVAVSLYVVGTTLLLAGLGCYAKSRGQSWVYCFFGFLGIIGFIVLLYLKDLTLSNQTEGTGAYLID